MSNTNTDTDDGRPVATATPPVDALATVTAGGDAITTVAVPADRTLTVSVTPDDREIDDRVDPLTTDEIPEPAHTDELPDDAHDAVTLSADSWVRLTVGGDRAAPRFTATAGEQLAVYLERAEQPDT